MDSKPLWLRPLESMPEDELLIRYAYYGIKHLSARELSRFSIDDVQEIMDLHLRARTLIVRLKKEIAHAWSVRVLRPFLGRKLSRTERVADLVINDVVDLQLDIVIPRPLLIEQIRLLRDKIRSKNPTICLQPSRSGSPKRSSTLPRTAGTLNMKDGTLYATTKKSR